MPTTSPHANATGTDLHEDKRIKAPVNAASTGNVSLAVPGGNLDGVTLASGNRVLLKNQTAPAENGIYVWTGAAVALTRASDADVAADFTLGFTVFVAAGTANGGTLWLFSQIAALTLGTTAITFTALGALGPTGPTGPGGPQGSVGPPGPPTTVSSALYVCIREQKASPSDGGTFTAGAWRTRVLNMVIANDSNLASLDTVLNRITLPPGTYRTYIGCPAATVASHVARLQNITTGETPLRGTVEYTATSISVNSRSIIAGIFGISSQSVFEIQHWANTTRATFGFGVGSTSGGTLDGGIEIYTVAEFWLVGLPPPASQGMIQPNPSFDPRRRAYAALM